MKVVFLTPTYNKNVILERSLEFLERLDPQPDHHIFLENNSQDGTLQTLKEWQQHHSAEIIRVWFRDDAVQVMGNPFEIIGYARQTLLEQARKHNPDYAIFVDDDIFLLEPDFITRLIHRKKHLVAASYSFPNALYKGIFLNALWQNGEKYVWRKSCSGMQKVCGLGSGAMCVSHELLMDERVSFLPITNPQLSEDFHYCERALEHGYQPYLDCGLKVGHCFRATDMGKTMRYWHHRPWSRLPLEDSQKTVKFYDFTFGKRLEGEETASKFVVFMPPEPKMDLLAHADARLD
jgi:GT2 family glycosyltransferase